MADAVAMLIERMRRGEVRALARAISVVEEGGTLAEELLAGCRETIARGVIEGRARPQRIGVTGSPGVGKSTLVDRMVSLLRQSGETVGVAAVDPTSPYTGGALLGDRIRMQGFGGDDGVYIRSMASRGAAGGVGRAAEEACLVMEAAGRDVLVIETVGVGQDEVGVTRLADAVVVVLAPGMGDEVQAMKAGIMEVADVFAVNKADLGGAERLEAEIAGMQQLGAGRKAAVVRTSGSSGEGVATLLEAARRVAADNGQPSAASGRQMAAPSSGRDRLALDHLGIAVRSLEAARGFYEGIGLRAGRVETVEHEGVKVMMLPLGGSRIELLEGLGPETTIGRFVARRGDGLHHVALRVTGIDGLFTRLKGDGVRVIGDQVQVGAGGHRYFFVHPASTGGVLLEMVEPG